MRSVIWLVLLFGVAVVAATTLGRNDGLVTVYWHGWRTELSLNLFVLLLIGCCALMVVAAKAIGTLLTLPRRAGAWQALRRERAAHGALTEALVEYFAARYGRARKAAERALVCAEGSSGIDKGSEFRMLAHLIAAGSLHRLQDRPGRDRKLQEALAAARGGPWGVPRLPDADGRSDQIEPVGGVKGLIEHARSSRSAEEAPRLLAAEWALDDRDASRALEALQALPAGAARRTQALRLKLKAARLARQPLEALHTARLLANHQAFSTDVAQSLTRSLVRETLAEAHSIDQLQRLWGQFDSADRRDPQVIAATALRAVHLDAADEARAWLRACWERLDELDADDRRSIALALMAARHGIGSEWLPRLERALGIAGHHAAVAAAVGMAYAECQLWGKSRPLLERTATATELPAATRRSIWRQLAALARRQADEPRALDCEQAAATLD